MKNIKSLLILGLFVLCCVSFCSAETYLDNFENYLIATGYVENTRTSSTPYTIYENTEQVDENFCLKIKNFSGNANNNRALTYGWGTSPNSSNLSVQVFIPYYGLNGNFFCSWGNKQYVNVVLFGNTSFDYELYDFGAFLNASVYQYSSLECQTEYNLIPISSVDSNYCSSNNLCPSSGGGECLSGEVLNRSALYINNIQHLGKPIINITIPEELDWNYYNLTGEFDLDIVGYNVDYDKINSIVDLQSYKPSQEDFDNIIGILAKYMPIVIIFIGLIFIYALLKKPFKSKKL